MSENTDKKRIALVTGGTGGIGTAVCRELASRGYKVVAGYFPPERERAQDWMETMRTAGFDVAVVPGDVTDFDSCAQMVMNVESNFGPVDVLVNNAGITRDKTLRKMTLDQWEAVLITNLHSAFNVTRHVVDGMSERGFGRIVNISSVNGQRGQFGQANYSAAKAGLHGFTMAVAQELATKGVTVNTISPGYVATAMTEAMTQNVLESIVAQVPMRRLGRPEEIASAVAWLADDMSGYITGANIPVNGGLYMT
ncbi:MAG: acetoacetyl-CoA reductase [Thiotrichales bacterium]